MKKRNSKRLRAEDQYRKNRRKPGNVKGKNTQEHIMDDELDYRTNLIAMITARLDDYPTEDIAQIYEDFCLQTLH